MSEPERDLLARGTAELDVSVDPRQVERLLRFLDRLYAWNPSAGFTTIARDDAVRLHLLDSLSIVRSLGSARSIADLGSGPGLPAIPLAIALPSVRVLALEIKRRRCSFMSEMARELEVANLEVRRCDVRTEATEPLDAVVARAFRSPGDLLPIAERIVAPAGRVILMLGGQVRRPLADVLGPTGGFATVDDREVVLPGGREKRRIVALARQR